MENYNGIAISKNDKEFVVAFDNFVNGKMQSATNTGKALATIHRYLQSQAFKVCVAYFRQLAVNYRTGYYDERNETAARRAAMMYDTLMNGDEIYDPILPQILIIYLTIVTQNYIFLYEIKLYNFADKYRFDIIYNSSFMSIYVKNSC
jgi:hypothetical protein